VLCFGLSLLEGRHSLLRKLLREKGICLSNVVTAELTYLQAGYEWAAHAPLAEKGGVTKEGLKILAVKDLSAVTAAEGVLSAKQLAVARYADAMTRDVKVSDATFGELKGLFNDKEVVEITATVSSMD
jgi:hypothetical protein